jgi:hypothetical protein
VNRLAPRATASRITIIERLQPVADIAPLLDQSVALTSYDQIMQMMLSEAPQQGQGEPHSHSGLIRHLTPDFAAVAAALLEAGASYFFAIRAVGGAVSDVPSDATAYGWREANFSVAAFGTRASGLDTWWETLLPTWRACISASRPRPAPRCSRVRSRPGT